MNPFIDKSLLDFHKSPITIVDIQRLESLCYEIVRNDDLYFVRNDAKLRAVYTSKSYDEFKDIVDAAHLRPLDKLDKKNANTKNRLWNSAAKEEDVMEIGAEQIENENVCENELIQEENYQK